jgi:hypothetical protein
MSLEYEIEKLFQKVKRSLDVQRNIVMKDFLSWYLPVVNVPAFSEDEDEEESKNIVDSIYLNDMQRPSDIIGSAS